jgi:hypothetical protein
MFCSFSTGFTSLESNWPVEDCLVTILIKRGYVEGPVVVVVVIIIIIIIIIYCN